MRVSRRQAMAGVVVALVLICAVGTGLFAANRARPRPPEMTSQERFLAGIPCAPPCWEGITPGVTHADDIPGLLLANPEVIDVQMEKRDAQSEISDYVTWRGEPESSLFGGAAELDGAVVRVVRVTFMDLCLGAIVEAYGEPDCIATSEIVLYDIDPEHRRADLLWLRLGMIAAMGTVWFNSDYDFQTIDAGTCGAVLEFYPPGMPPVGVGPVTGWHGYDDFDAYLGQVGGCGEQPSP